MVFAIHELGAAIESKPLEQRKTQRTFSVGLGSEKQVCLPTRSCCPIFVLFMRDGFGSHFKRIILRAHFRDA